MRHLKKSVTDKVTLFYCYFDSEHPRYTWVVVANNTMTIAKKYEVLVPTMHVGCSNMKTAIADVAFSFSTHDARGL